MPLDPEFVADCPYGPGGLLLDEILLVDAEQHLVRVRMPISAELPLTREQRAHPIRHPQHVSGGLMVHMTGMVGFVHAYYVLGLKHSEGWVGYGAKIHSARFKALARVTDDCDFLVLEGRANQVRRGDTSVFARYTFKFTQRVAGEDIVIYEGDQSAFWTNVNVTTRTSPTSNTSATSATSPGRPAEAIAQSGE